MNKLFIIEDDINLLTAIRAKFNVMGYGTEVSNGEDTLNGIVEKIKLSKADYIILDLLLPRLDGFDLLYAIKADPDTAAIPVFVFSDLSEADAGQRCRRLGADFYFIKTDFGLDLFTDKINKIIINRDKKHGG